MNHQDKRVLITAAASGIGRVMAEAFLDAGAKVHICDIVPDALDACRTELPEIGATLVDVSRQD